MKFYSLFLKDIDAYNFISNVLFDHLVLLTSTYIISEFHIYIYKCLSLLL